MKSSAGRPREFDPDAFLNTALDCFWQHGYQATSMADLMKASGLASASIYKLYPDKRAIYLAALQRYMDEGTSRTKKRTAEMTPEAALREMLDFAAQLSSAPAGERGCFTIAAASELLPGDEEVKSKVFAKFENIIDELECILLRGQQQKVFRQDEEARVIAKSLFMMIEGMRIYGKIQPEIEDIRRSNDFIIRTLLLNVNNGAGDRTAKASA
ncbi:TetR/AcrR family transcriptional regulator [Pantoea sp. Bo_2]|uniref:TetR/AcrR family transcriptional regulator n=1 Tax=Candidatus Pantoea gossypiicola TaxID=2608008 RepID=A0AB34CK73_9GAMM|nr:MULTISPECIES: TetR/AcrR family transcriptional regulator [Pantoea]KAA5931615.1 TetR/AcrR family transcriptional regulator [Pantoea sp. VH_8]KAA5936750.1 TetR/AcrR family transcriptional regulator [Pantoea sp. VH_4]KAA5948309.1 TetR/AcrR family transcriptional regulator [Pantoea sp. VH_3]KAA5953579.1 TetR/AcrR family transcriptional regulator [Pantoea sp. VH_25]KAA5956585.1 TetR/AcrR family transcriptional regulator [Pantoea sp. VH_24]